MMIPTTIIMASQLPKLPLQTILSLRTLCSSIINELKDVSTKEHILTNILDFQPDSNHYVMASVLILFLYGQYKYSEGQHSLDKRIEKIDRFRDLKKITSEIIFVFFIVFTKNVTEVF